MHDYSIILLQEAHETGRELHNSPPSLTFHTASDKSWHKRRQNMKCSMNISCYNQFLAILIT